MTTIHNAGVTTTAETNYCRPLANTLHSYNKQTNKQTNKQICCYYEQAWFKIVSTCCLKC